MSYPTQEDELRAKEAEAEDLKRAEEQVFLSTFQNVPKKNGLMLFDKANAILNSFNSIMAKSRQRPFERQEDIMAGIKKLFEEQINVIEARLAMARRLKPGA